MKRSVAAVPAVRDPKIRILLLLTALLLGSSECFHRFFHDGAVACGGAAAVFRIAPLR